MNILYWLKPFTRKMEQALVKNAPHLLMGLGTGCSISALIFAAKAAPEANQAVAEKRYEKAEEERRNTGENVAPLRKLTFREWIQAVWKYYGPAVAMELLALICFWAAHGIDIRRQAVLSGLCATAEQALQEYQRKVQQMIGEKAEKEIHNSIAQDTADRLPAPPDANPLPPGSCDRWAVIKRGDSVSPYFLTSYIKIKDAENQINHDMIGQMYATESDLYWLLDPDRRWLIRSGNSGMIGWSIDRLLVLDVTECDGPDHTPIYVITYKDKDGCDYEPRPGYSTMY